MQDDATTLLETATAAPHETKGLRRAKIGLALGGGVARGWAHIGAVRALSRAGIEPDIICGTSVGALVGGCYLAGRLDALETWARSLTKRRMLGYFDLIVGGGGIIGGKRLENVMRRYLKGQTIEGLPRTFAAVCSELATGHETWLQEGDLIKAIEASYALPGVFSPRKVSGRWLVDGALVNPLPVSVCRALGARMVIAVGLHADAFGKAAVRRRDKYDDIEFTEGESLQDAAKGLPAERLMLRQLFGMTNRAPGLGTVMLASLNIVMDRLTRSRLAGDPPDVLVAPRVGHTGLLDFDKADELIRLGEEAVEREMPIIEEALAILS
ncbi:MAG: patatin-like phospholipase family protein [Pseudomonadota bacterium]